MLSLICGISKMKQTTVYNKTEADTDIENKLVVISGEREGGGGLYICDFREGSIHVIKHTFWQKVAASHQEQRSPLMILVLF